MKSALIVIDIQNDYFADGLFPQWEAEATLARIEGMVTEAQARRIPVILAQHIAAGAAPFFNAETPGVAIHPRLLARAPEAPIIVKTHADSFLDTTLEATLQALGCEELWLCGMMTQNCVTHTALSPQATKYRVKVLADGCSSVSQMIHLIALRALADRVEVCGGLPMASALPA